ncbi:hypothetical protein AB990_08425 [Alkalihalobacillus pseudalcaliphilus]|nr:hypothetical protein AB990_08425 [Alkalihalobacillus pseudalcaliphilus]
MADSCTNSLMRPRKRRAEAQARPAESVSPILGALIEDVHIILSNFHIKSKKMRFLVKNVKSGGYFKPY